MQPVSVVLADDHPILREGLVAFFNARPELHIVGQCSDGLAAIQMVKTLAPDFALIDLHLPKLHGLEVIQKLREANSPSKLVILTISHDEKMVRWALRAGADGYLVKDGPASQLFDAIRDIQSGGVYISPLLRRDLLQSETDDGPDGTPSEGCAGVTAPMLPRRPRRPPMAFKLPLPE